MPDASNAADHARTAQKPLNNWRRRFIDKIKRCFEQRRVKKREESTSDMAVRSTAWATWVIAIFTVVMATVTSLTLWEIHAGGVDTHNLAAAAKEQAQTLKTQSDLYERQVEGIEKAVVYFDVYLDNSSGVTLTASNVGKVYASDVRAQLTVTRRFIATGKTIGEPITHRVGPLQLAPAHQGEGVFQKNWQVGLTNNDWKAMERREQTILIEGHFSYEDGFGNTIIAAPYCKSMLYWDDVPVDHHTGDGLIECADFSNMMDAIRKSQKELGIKSSDETKKPI